VTAKYTHSEFFVLRTPLLPIEDFLQLSSPLANLSQGHVAGSSERASARAHLRHWAGLPVVREALWIASPEFVQSLTTLWDDPERGKGRKLEQALYRYLARMTARPTPFGAFAGCSTGEIADSTRLELGPRSQYVRHTRLDMEYLCSLAEYLSGSPQRRRTLRFSSNTSLHRAAGRYHHVRGNWQDGDQVFHLVATDPTPALDATLSRAASGAEAGALASALVADDPETTPEEADAFISQLIESQVLVAELVPPVTGTEAIRYMVEQLERANASEAAEDLQAVAKELHALDQRGLGAAPSAYDEIVNAVSRLGGKFQPGRLIHLDVIKPAAMASLDQRLVKEILDAVETLHSIRDDSGDSTFQQFKDDFEDRYQDRELPLLEALDDEAGIGFESEANPTTEPLIAGIDFRPAADASPLKDTEDEKLRPILARRLKELQAKREIVLALDSELLRELSAGNPPPMPDAFSVMGIFFRGPDGQEGFYLQNASGPSGVNLLARFRHADARLAGLIQEHIAAEEELRPGSAVFAEIAHLPEGRAGNVVCRPVLRRYEIPLLATPGVPADRQIALSDLTVSLHNGRVVLRSRRLGVEVLPRLTSAHNFASPRSLKLYKFLCLLQHQGTCADVLWDWGTTGQSSFLPRVTLSNIVVSLACWRLNKESAFELSRRRIPLELWRQTNQVPRFAFITESDNQLLIDFDNPLGVETFLEHLRKQPETLLVEMFPSPAALAVRGPEGTFVHEIILPCVRQIKAKAPADVAPMEASAPARYSPSANSWLDDFQFDPGSEWLFAKLYCSPSHADRLLLDFVQPLVADIMSVGAANLWFFVRYGDPRWHLRLRFHGDPAALRDHILPTLGRMAEPCQRQGTLWRVRFERYEPEVARYGGPRGIGIAERFFQFDSELCLKLLPLFQSDAGAELRWQLAFLGVDRILAGLGFSTAEKKALAEHMRASREQAWAVDKTYRRQLARKFRSGQLRQTLTAILNDFDDRNSRDDGVLPLEAVSAFRHFSARLQFIRGQWQDLRQAGQFASTMPEITESLVHMHLNRILRSCHHEQEAVLYDSLVRIYAANLAREQR